MRSINKILVLLTIISFLIFSCEDEFGPRNESVPVIESAELSPSTFTFGDSIFLKAKINDSATKLAFLDYEIVSDNHVITKGQIPLNGESYEVNEQIFIPLLKNQSDNASVVVNLTAINILKGVTSSHIEGITGKRPVYEKLYLVTEDGAVALLSKSGNSFSSSDLTFDTSFNYKIAEKINSDNSINYSGDVYGNKNGKIEMIDETGEYAFVYASNSDYTKEFTFDNLSFEIQAKGSKLGADDFSLTSFGDTDVGGETFRTNKRNLENGKTYSLFGRLADSNNIYNPDFFERISPTKVKFIGESGEYTLYYNPVRKNIFVGVDSPSYPEYLLVCGWGLGYPTHVTSAEIASVYPGKKRTHTDWGFDHVLKYVLMPRISDGVYQGTFYTPGDDDHYAGFKPFENTGWGNEKQAGQFTFTGEKIISGDNNWDIPNGEDDPIIESTNYRFKIDLNNKTVHIEKINL